MSAMYDNLASPRWLTWWAYLTVLAVCPLLFIGALVTTLKVGMADQRSVVSPVEAIFEMFGSDKSIGWKIEHGHRLAGWFAGICGIGLAVGFWIGEKGHWFRWLGLLGLSLITAQGLLGIFRVQLNALCGRDLAWIHGCFAQLVFAVLASLAMLVSPGWRSQRGPVAPSLPKWSLVCLGLVFGQLVMGGIIRHQPSLLIARFHILGAFVVLTALLYLVKLMLESGLRLLGWLVLGLVGLEILLGVETGVHWMARFFSPTFAANETMAQMLTRTTHYFVGSLVFASTALAAVQAHRQAFSLVRIAPMPKPATEVPSLAAKSLQGGIA